MYSSIWTACPLLRHLSGRVCPHQSWEFCVQLREATEPRPFQSRLSPRQLPSVQEQLPGAHSGTIGPADIKLGVPALLADKHFGNIGLADLGTGQVDPGVALVTLDHGPTSKGLHAEAGDQIPGVVICKTANT